MKKLYITNIIMYITLIFISIVYGKHILILTSTESFLSNATSHTIDIPLTTTKTCNNFCNPQSTCAMTGQQCLTDADCSGCQAIAQEKKEPYGPAVPGYSRANLTHTFAVNNNYVELDSIDSPAPPANFGKDVLGATINFQQQQFNKVFKAPDNMQFMPQYKTQYGVTGMFQTQGPLPANY